MEAGLTFDRRLVATPVGVVTLDVTDGEGALVFAITGAFAPQTYGRGWRFPGARVVVADLPGLHTAALVSASVEIFADAFDAALQEAFPDEPAHVIGQSLGAVVALNMRSAAVLSITASEPFFSNARGALYERVAALLGRAPAVDRFAADVLGYFPTRIEPRTWAIRTKAPITALLGAGPTPYGIMPTLATEEDEAALRHVGAKVTRLPCGHDLPRYQPDAWATAVEASLRGF